MGVRSSVPTAPAGPILPHREASRRRSSNLTLRAKRNSAWGESTIATSRGSVVEVPCAPVEEAVRNTDEVPAVTVPDEDHRERVGPTESTFSASNRSLLSGFKRRVSKSNLRQQPVVSEFLKELHLIKRNILSNKPWIDGFAVMWIVLYNTFTSVVVAWAIACVYAVGSPVSSMFSIPRKRHQSVSRVDSLLFTTAIGAYFVVFVCLGHALTKSCILTDRLLSVYMSLRHSFRRTLSNYLRVAIHRIVLAVIAGAGVLGAMDLVRVDYQGVGRCQLLILVLIAGTYIDYAIRHARHVRRRIAENLRLESARTSSNAANPSLVSAPSLETIRTALDSSAVAVRSPNVSRLRRLSTMSIVFRAGSSKTLFQKLLSGHRCFTVSSMCVMFGYMHLALALHMVHQWQITLFAAFSFTVKIAIQEATKQLFLAPPKKPSARMTHMLMTIPTVMIDAQVRMVFVQMSLSKAESSSSVFTSSFIIVVCKIVFRIAKIMRLRHTITSRLTHSKGMQRIMKRVNSKIAVRDVAVARAEYSQFLDWKNQKLRLHAAEVYADMHGEYISIGLAMGIVFFFTDHTMYALQADDTQIPRQLVSAVVQLGTGLVFDYLANVVEGVHEVPLYEAIGDEGRGLRVFMHVLLGALTAVNVGIVAVFLLRQTE